MRGIRFSVDSVAPVDLACSTKVYLYHTNHDVFGALMGVRKGSIAITNTTFQVPRLGMYNYIVVGSNGKRVYLIFVL